MRLNFSFVSDTLYLLFLGYMGQNNSKLTVSLCYIFFADPEIWFSIFVSPGGREIHECFEGEAITVRSLKCVIVISIS